MSRVVFFIAMRQLWDRKLLNGIAVWDRLIQLSKKSMSEA